MSDYSGELAYCGHPMTSPRECGQCLAGARAEVERQSKAMVILDEQVGKYQVEVERLREALIKIHDLHPYCGCAGLVESLRPDVCEDNCAWSITRAALGETEKTHPMAQEMLATAARPVEELAGSTPCPECGFVKSHCRCAVLGEGEKGG